MPTPVDPLFVPADRPDRVAKAMGEGVDAVIVDLEDAVAAANKATARDLVVELLRDIAADRPCAVLVRVNSRSDGGHLERDIEALRPCLDAVDGLVLPKVESAGDLRHLSGLLARPVPVIPLVETARGIDQAVEIAAATPAGGTLLFGPADLSAELGVVPSPDGLELLVARSHVVMACALARLPKPIDGPYLVVGDEDGMATSARHARRLGFGGKAAIHPRQLAAIRAAFAPTPDEVAWARRVVAAYEEAVRAGIGAVRLEDGTFVDVPVAERARAILRTGTGGGEAGS
jgi:citrate lyase subunit beta/citryl-CoA lyase